MLQFQIFFTYAKITEEIKMLCTFIVYHVNTNAEHFIPYKAALKFSWVPNPNLCSWTSLFFFMCT